MPRFFNITAGTIDFTNADSGTASVDIDHFSNQTFTAFVSGTIEETPIYSNIRSITSGTHVSNPSTLSADTDIMNTDTATGVGVGALGNDYLIQSGTVSSPNAIYVSNTGAFGNKTAGYPMIGIGARSANTAEGYIQYRDKFAVDTITSFEFVKGSNSIHLGIGYNTSFSDDGQTIAVQYSTDGTNWTTQGDVVDATAGSATAFTSVSRSISRSTVGADYYVRLFFSTTGAPTASAIWVIGIGELNIQHQTDSDETNNTVADVAVTATYNSSTKILTAYTTSKLTGKIHYKIISSK